MNFGRSNTALGLLALVVAVAFGTAGCFGTRGRRVFTANCEACHPGGESGIGPAINDKPLPGFMIKFQVRNGIGAMPAFSKREIPSDDLDDLVEYLTALRRHG